MVIRDSHIVMRGKPIVSEISNSVQGSIWGLTSFQPSYSVAENMCFGDPGGLTIP